VKSPPKSSPAAGLRCTFFACGGQNRNDLMSAFSWGQPKTDPLDWAALEFLWSIALSNFYWT